MTNIVLTAAEAIEACADYVAGSSKFSIERRAFIYTGKGWGSPAMIREAMARDYMKAHDAYVTLRDKTCDSLALAIAHQRLERIRNVSEACRQEGFIQALATGALKVEAKWSGESFYRVVNPSEAATFRFDSASNSAVGAERKYSALKFTPAEKPIRGKGRPTSRPLMAAIFEESRAELENLGPTEIGRRVAEELHKRTKASVKPDTVTRSLQDMGCIPKRASRKK